MKIKNLTAGATVGELEQANIRIADLESRLAEAQRIVERTVKQCDGHTKKAEAEERRLREVLKQVEWVYDAQQDLYCPWCRRWQDEVHDNDKDIGHALDCSRQAALSRAPLGKITTRLPLPSKSSRSKRQDKSNNNNR